jgi:hypothetical protein
MWTKKGKKFHVTAEKGVTTFNLDGMILKQPEMSQEEANQFLNMNGYDGFAVDNGSDAEPTQKASKGTAGKASVGTKINGKSSSDLKDELKF